MARSYHLSYLKTGAPGPLLALKLSQPASVLYSYLDRPHSVFLGISTTLFATSTALSDPLSGLIL